MVYKMENTKRVGERFTSKYNQWVTGVPNTKETPVRIGPEVKSTLKTFLETTSVKGVSKVAKNTSRVLRTVWAIAVVTGLSVAVWQITSLLVRYFAYGTITNLNICNDCRAPFPDLTVCNLNPLSAVAHFGLQPFNTYLHDFDALATEILRDEERYEAMKVATGMHTDDEIFKLYEEMFSITGYFQNINQTLFWEALALYGKNILVHDCNWYDWEHKLYIKGNCRTESVYLNYNPELLMCFTIHLNESTEGVSDDVIAGLSAILYTNDSPNYTMPKYPQNIHSSQSKGIRVLIHPRNTFPDVAQGFDVSPGNDITINIEAQRWQRLGEPYAPCSDERYLESTRGTHHHSASETIRHVYTDTSGYFRCMQEDNLKRCRCFNPHLPITPGLSKSYSHLPLCGSLPGNHPDVVNITQTAVNVACYFKANHGDSDAIETCQFSQACTEYRYTFSSSISEWPHESYQLPFYENIIKSNDERQTKFSNKFDVYGNITALMRADPGSAFEQLRHQDVIRRNFIQLKLRFQKEGLMVYSDVPSLTLDSFFGTMGGVLNLWIGVTFFTLIELIDLVYKLTSLICGKQKESNKKKVSSVDPL